MTVPSAAAVRRMARRARRANVPGGLADTAGDVYMALLTVGFVVATVISSVHRQSAPATVHSRPFAAATLILALALLLAGGALLAFAAAGPISAGAAAQTWELSTPGARSRWLAPRLGWLLGTAACLGVVLGAVVELATAKGLVSAGSSLPGRQALAWGAGLGALVATTLAAGAVSGQPRGSRVTTTIGRILLALGLLASVAALVLEHRGNDLEYLDVATGPLSYVVVIIVLLFCCFRAVRALPRLDRAALSTGADLTNSALVAAVGMDPSMLAGAVQLRRLRSRGRVRGRRLRATSRRTALLAAEARRIQRHPTVVVSYFALMMAPYLGAIVLGPSLVTLVKVLAASVATYGLAGGLRAVCRSASLRRALGGTNADLRVTHLIVPSVGAVIWLTATAPAGRALNPTATALVLVGIIAAVYRTAGRQSIDYDTAWATSPVGPLPLGLLAQSLRGLDLAIVVAALTAYWPGTK